MRDSRHGAVKQERPPGRRPARNTTIEDGQPSHHCHPCTRRIETSCSQEWVDNRLVAGPPRYRPKRGDLGPGVTHAQLTRGGSIGCTLGTGPTARVIAPGAPLGTPQLFYDACAFALPNLGFNGTAGRSIVYGPDFSNVNFSLVKDTPLPKLGESGSLQFRTEVFNVLNHPSLGVPSRTFNLTTAGQITSTFSRSREIQFALKVLF